MLINHSSFILYVCDLLLNSRSVSFKFNLLRIPFSQFDLEKKLYFFRAAMKQNNLKCFILLFLSNFKAEAEAGKNDLKLVILHLNDFHAHIEQTTENLTRCRQGLCFLNFYLTKDNCLTKLLKDNWKFDQVSSRFVQF